MSRTLFGGEVWCTYYRAIDDPNDAVNANLANMPGRDLWSGAGSCRDRLVPRFDILDPDLRPMSQESTSAGFDFAVSPRTVASEHFVHNRLIRTIEDLGALVDGSQVYLIANPGEGTQRSHPQWHQSPPSFPMPKTETAVRRCRAWRQPPNRKQLVRQRKPDSKPSVWQLRGSRELGRIRTPTTGVSWATAQQQAGSMFRQGGNLTAGGTSTTRCSTRTATSTCSAGSRRIVLWSPSSTAATTAQNTQIGAFVYVGSGTPMTTYVNSVNQTEIFVEGRGDMGRTPMFSKTDLLLSHELPMAGNKRLRLELNVLNLFNQKTARHVFNFLNRGAVRLGRRQRSTWPHRSVQGLRLQRPDPGDARRRERLDPRYGMDDLFEAGTQGQVSVKFLFYSSSRFVGS